MIGAYVTPVNKSVTPKKNPKDNTRSTIREGIYYNEKARINRQHVVHQTYVRTKP